MFLRDVEEDPELRQTLALYKANQQEKSKNKMSEGQQDAMSVAETEDSGTEEVPKINVDDLLDDFDELNVQDEE